MTSLTIPKDDAQVQIALGALQWGASHSQPSASKSTKQTALGSVAFAWQRQRERTSLESISAEIRWSWVSWNFPKVAASLLVFPWNQLQSCDCCVDCEFIVHCEFIVLNLLSCSHWRDLFFSAGDIASQCFTILLLVFQLSLKMPGPNKG